MNWTNSRRNNRSWFLSPSRTSVNIPVQCSSAHYGLFTQNLTGSGPGQEPGPILGLSFHTTRGMGPGTGSLDIICTCYCTRKGTCYCTRKGTKWLGKPLVPFLVPVPVPLQCENFHIIYSEPIYLVPVPLLVPFTGLLVYSRTGSGDRKKMGCKRLYRTFHITQGPGPHCFLLC